MPFIQDLSQTEEVFEPGDNKPKMKKKFMTARFPLSIIGDQKFKPNDMAVTVIIGPIKGFSDSKFNKEIEIEAQKGGVYLGVKGDLGDRLRKAFDKKEMKDA